MKREVQFINSSSNKVIAVNLSDLIKNFEFIGFESEDNERYMIIHGGPYRGIAVNCYNCWLTTAEEQVQDEGGIYFVFDTMNELYDWMKG